MTTTNDKEDVDIVADSPGSKMLESDEKELKPEATMDTASSVASTFSKESKDQRRRETLRKRHASIQQLYIPKEQETTNTKNTSSKGSPSSKSTTTESHQHILLSKLQDMYLNTILPLEHKYHMHSFCLPTSGPLTAEEFHAKPMVMVVGAYSTGKTTFLSHLLGNREFPGMHIGPEPTTDKFMALVYGGDKESDSDGSTSSSAKKDQGQDEEPNNKTDTEEDTSNTTPAVSGTILKGNTVTVTPSLPFAGLTQFGSAFLHHFNASICDAPLLQYVTLIDTPGVMSSQRSYPYDTACKWFADRADLILLLFDAQKLNVMHTPFVQLLHTIRPHNDDKMRCVLNKCDALPAEAFVRVYGSLLWHLAQLWGSTSVSEVVRVYCGSFWDQPLRYTAMEHLMETDEALLIDELIGLPSVAAERKVNALVKRMRLVKVHMCLLGHMGDQVRSTFSPQAKQQTILRNLEAVMEDVRRKYHLSAGDMPGVEEMREKLTQFDDFSRFPSVDRTALHTLDNLMTKEIPSLLLAAERASGAKKQQSKSFLYGSAATTRGGAPATSLRSWMYWCVGVLVLLVALLLPTNGPLGTVTGVPSVDTLLETVTQLYQTALQQVAAAVDGRGSTATSSASPPDDAISISMETEL